MAFVQGKIATDDSGVAHTTLVITVDAPITTGGFVALTVGWHSIASDAGADNPQITADQELPTPNSIPNATGADDYGLYSFFYTGVLTNPTQFTVTFAVGVDFQWATVSEYSRTGAIDDTNANSANNIVAVVTNRDNERIYATGVARSGNTSPGSGYAARLQGTTVGGGVSGGVSFITEDQFIPAASPGTAANFTTTSPSSSCLINATSMQTSDGQLTTVVSQNWDDRWRDIRAVPSD